MTDMTTTQIQFIDKVKDEGTMIRTIQSVYDLTLEIQSAQLAIAEAIANGFDVYKDKIDDTAKKGDYSKFIKKAVAEIIEGKVTSEVEALENILDYIDLIKKNIK